MKNFKRLTILFVLTTMLVVAVGPSSSVLAGPTAVAPDLASAATFVVLAGSTVTNTGTGFFIGNVGTSPGLSVTGFPPGTVVDGAIYMGGPVPAQAQTDANAAFVALGGQSCGVNLTGQDLGG